MGKVQASAYQSESYPPALNIKNGLFGSLALMQKKKAKAFPKFALPRF